MQLHFVDKILTSVVRLMYDAEYNTGQ